MLLILAITLGVSLILSFFLITPKITIGELLATIMATSVIHQDYMAILSLNLGQIDIGQRLDLYWTQTVLRMFIYPLLLTWYMNLYTISTSVLQKIIYMLLTVVVLTAIEATAEKFGVIRFLHWNWYWEAISWMVTIAFAHGVVKFYRWLETKG